MYCPECRSEYRDGFTECADCQIGLVAELAPPLADNEVEAVPVYSTSDEATCALVQSILGAAGIEHFTTNQQAQDLFGLGRIGGYNPLVGPVQILVANDRSEEAIQLIKEAVSTNAEEV